MKTDLEKLHEHKMSQDSENTSTVESDAECQTEQKIATNEEQSEKRFLLDDYMDVYKSIKVERFPTSMVINRNVLGQIEAVQPESNENEQNSVRNVDIKAVNDLATVLVKSIIEKAVSEVQSNPQTDCYDPGYIKRVYLASSKKSNGQNSEILNEFNANKSNSRLSYYKEFQTDMDVVMNEFGRAADQNGEENEADKFVLQFEDEPAEYVNFFVFSF